MQTISRIDYGAGSSFGKENQTITVSSIAKNALSRPFQCRFMARLASFSKPIHILEFGTSLGLTTTYLAGAAPQAKVTTIEGDPEIFKLARDHFQSLSFDNIVAICMTFDEFIDSYAAKDDKIDLLFLDGHHKYDATIHYYSALQSRFHAGTIVIVDDIYWSPEMTTCWKALIAREEVTQSVDCFHFGLLFYNTDFINKENHKVQLPVRMLMH
jgi:predicted O-methyltransferase YrrM